MQRQKEKDVQHMTMLEMCDELAKGWALDQRADEIITEVRRRKFARQFDPVIMIDEVTDAMEGRR